MGTILRLLFAITTLNIKITHGRYGLSLENVSSIEELQQTIYNNRHQVELFRPVLHSNDSVLVDVLIQLYQIIAFNEDTQILTTSVFYEERWRDPFFVWNPESIYGIKEIQLDARSIWLPKIRLANNADLQYLKEDAKDRQVHIFNDGVIHYRFPIVLSTICVVQNKYFPFDDQTCPITFQSYSKEQQDLRNYYYKSSDQHHNETYQTNNEWGLVRVLMERAEQGFESENKTYVTLSLTIKMRRRYTLMFMYLIFPNVLINFIAVSQFMLPCDTGEKVALSITIYLSMTVFLLVIQEILPSTNEVPVLVGYLLALMALSALSELITIFVLICHFGGLTNYHNRVPIFLRKWVLKRIGFLLSWEKYVYPGQAIDNKMIQNLSFMSLYERKPDNNTDGGSDEESFEAIPAVNRLFRKSIFNKNSALSRSFIADSRFSSNQWGRRKLSGTAVDPSFIKVEKKNKTSTMEDDANTARMFFTLVQLSQEQNNYHHDKDKEEIIKWEWQQVAMVIDRFMFYVYLLLTTVFWISFYFQIPERDGEIIK